MCLGANCRAIAAGLFMALAALTAGSALAAEEGLTVHDAWIQAVPAAKTPAAAYFTIMNSGSASRQLVAAESDSFEKAMLHVSRVTNGIATMEHVAQVDVPAKGSVKFAPGGLHVMLIGPKAPLAAGAKVNLRLVFADGTKLPVTAVVKAVGGGAHMGHMDHTH